MRKSTTTIVVKTIITGRGVDVGEIVRGELSLVWGTEGDRVPLLSLTEDWI